MGRCVLPPSAGSPLRFLCSSTMRERRFGSRRGRHGTGSTMTSTLPRSATARSPNPSRRQSFDAGIAPPVRVPGAKRAPPARPQLCRPAIRSTACRTGSRESQVSQPAMTTAVGVPSSKATTSHPHTSPFARPTNSGEGRKVVVPHGRTRHCPVLAFETWLARSVGMVGLSLRSVDVAPDITAVGQIPSRETGSGPSLSHRAQLRER